MSSNKEEGTTEREDVGEKLSKEEDKSKPTEEEDDSSPPAADGSESLSGELPAEEEHEGTTEHESDLSSRLNELRGMMGNFFIQTPTQANAIDLILAKVTDTTSAADISDLLEELLEKDEFLSDLRRGKASLVAFLVKPATLERMISYIADDMDVAYETQKYRKRMEKYHLNSLEQNSDGTPFVPTPTEDELRDRRKRCAHLSYETIQSTDSVKESLVINASPLLDKFFTFLDSPIAENDPLRCAYFSRIVELLFEKFPKELVGYLRRRNCMVAKFVWHLENQYIVESLFRLIDSQISHQWLHDEDLIPLLMFKMAEIPEDYENLTDSGDGSSSSQSNNNNNANTLTRSSAREKTAATFVEILDLFVPFPYSILTTQMFHSDIVAEQWEQFTIPISDADASSNLLTNSSVTKNLTKVDLEKVKCGLSVAIGILNLAYEGNMSDETPVFMATAIKRLDFFFALLKFPPTASTSEGSSFEMTYGSLSPPFGFLRVKVLEFLTALLATKYRSVVDALWNKGEEYFSILLDLFFYYKWNNVVHHYIDQIIRTVICLASGTYPSAINTSLSGAIPPATAHHDAFSPDKLKQMDEDRLRVASTLIASEKCHLGLRIMNAFLKESPRSVGYLGHLTHISNEIIKLAESCEPVQSALDKISWEAGIVSSEASPWKKLLVGEALAEVNRRNNTPIAGGPPNDNVSPHQFMGASSAASASSTTSSSSSEDELLGSGEGV